METVKEKLAILFNDYWGVTMTVEELVNVFVSSGVTLQDAKPLNEFLAPIDEYQGLKQKYLVFKADSGERVMDCFVLRPQKDLAAAEALRAYANATDNKVLADDIRNWIGEGEVLQNATDTNVGDKWVHDEGGCWYCPKCGCTPAYWEAKRENPYGLPPYCHSCGAKLEPPKGVQ